MKTITKAILLFLLYVIILPVLISFGISFIFQVNIWVTLLTIVSISILFDVFLKKIMAYRQLVKFTKKYESLPYKSYVTPLTCNSCGQKNPVELDLSKNTEFTCIACSRKNAVYITFSTALAGTHEKL